MKKIFLLIAAFCAMSYFAACSDLLGEPKNNVAIATENGLSSGGAVLPFSSGEAMLSFSLDAKAAGLSFHFQAARLCFHFRLTQKTTFPAAPCLT